VFLIFWWYQNKVNNTVETAALQDKIILQYQIMTRLYEVTNKNANLQVDQITILLLFINFLCCSY
jgi:hypothetical protein